MRYATKTGGNRPLMLLVLCLLPAWGAGAEGRDGHPPGPPPPIEAILEENADRLNLDPAVAEQVRILSSSSRERGDAIRQQLHAAHNEMREMLSQESPDETAVMRQAEKIGELEVVARKDRLRGMLRVRALLTFDERAELVRIHQEHRVETPMNRHREGPPRGAPPPPGRH